MKYRKYAGIGLLCLMGATAQAAGTVAGLLDDYRQQGVSQFSAAEGEKLWTSVHNGRSCTSCHTKSVRNTGKHQRTKKVIKPMAPSVNPKRLTERKKVKKWLLRNCKWTFKRSCTPQEKGNILVWLRQQ